MTTNRIAAYNREHYLRNKDQLLAKRKALRDEDPEAARAYARAQRAKRMAENPKVVLMKEREAARRYADKLRGDAPKRGRGRPRSELSAEERAERNREARRKSAAKRRAEPEAVRAKGREYRAEKMREDPEAFLSAERERLRRFRAATARPPKPVLSDEEKAAKLREYNRDYKRKQRAAAAGTAEPPKEPQ